MSLDIFNPVVSVVPKGIEGKSFLLYGGNRCGKTSQSTKAKKPYYLAFEKGINGIAGVPFAPIQKWSDFVKINKQLTKPDTLSKAKEMYQTIIFDTVEQASLMCQDYICQQFDATSIGDAKKGFGAWKEYEAEFNRQINLLTSAGYTVIFISHESTRAFYNENGEKYDKIYPSGDKRSIDPVCNLVDVIAWLRPNGFDADGNERKSSAYLVNTPQYQAGSRFDFLPSHLEEFTMENLENALIVAVEKQEELAKGSTGSYASYTETYKTEEVPFKQLVASVGELAKKLAEANRFNEYEDLVAKYLSAGAKVGEAKPSQRQQVELILDELKTMC